MASKTTLNEKSEIVWSVAIRMPSQMTVREVTDKLKIFPIIERVTTLGDAFSNLVSNQMLDPNKNKKILISPRKFWWFGVFLTDKMKFSKIKKTLKNTGIVDKVSLPPYGDVEPDDYLNDAGLTGYSPNENRKMTKPTISETKLIQAILGGNLSGAKNMLEQKLYSKSKKRVLESADFPSFDDTPEPQMALSRTAGPKKNVWIVQLRGPKSTYQKTFEMSQKSVAQTLVKQTQEMIKQKPNASQYSVELFLNSPWENEPEI